ncbi:MAG TPA: TIGR01458 family HAD-type hydrolase [Gammaproteobacteria bacterium]|nr:TIGR01458 family HAD-type hydrolase [Gammaproteobacteria bacterium]
MGPRPPDILRKSHAHTEGKTRAKGRQALREALDASLSEPAVWRALLIDLDGVVYRGDEPVAGAAETVRRIKAEQIPHLFVTNTTSRPREAIVVRLADFGIDVAIDEILAPPDAAADWLAARGAKRLLLGVPEATGSAFGGFETLTLDEMAARQKAAGATGEIPGVDAVVVGDLGKDWTFDRLNAAFRSLMGEPEPLLIALGMTRYWHAPEGLRLDTAPFVVALSHASGVEPTVLGKPSAEFFRAALDRLGATAGETAMIGDDIRVDVEGAKAAGLKGILVRTGKYRPGDLELGIEPDLVLESFADLVTSAQ